MDLIEAAKKGDFAQVTQLLNDGIPVDSTDDYGITALMWASGRGEFRVVELLLDHDANVNKEDHVSGYTALMDACRNGHDDVVALLLDHGANIGDEEMTNDGMTELMWASQGGHVRVVELLLAHDVDVNRVRTNFDGCTALMYASQYGYADVVEKLLEKGADPNLRNDKKESAYDLASGEAKTDILQKLLDAGYHHAKKPKSATKRGKRGGGGSQSVKMKFDLIHRFQT